MTVDLIFERNRDSITLPVNPEHIKIGIPGNNEKVNIVSLGEIVVPGEPGLSSFDISSFFPPEDRLTYTTFFKKWMDSKTPAQFTASGLGVDMQTVIESFDSDRRAGEEGRIYYDLSFTEYRPYGAKIITLTTPTAATPAAKARTDNKPAVGQTYTVKAGDSLWAISKRLSNQGGANWRELYNANKAVIGGNPDLIYAGQVYTIPASWVTS